MKTRTSSTGERGFTLVELMVVIVLVAVLLGMITPRLVSGIRPAQIKERARRLLVAARYARSFAVAHQCVCRLAVLPADNAYCLEYQPDPERCPTEFAVMRGGLARLERLEQGVRFGRVYVNPTGPDGAAAEEGCIAFYPSGEADAALLEITDGRRTYTLVVLPSSGRVRLIEGIPDSVPGDRRDLDA